MATNPWSRRDAAVLLAGLIAIVAYCAIVSSGRILWSDEQFSWMLLTEPSWHRMLQAWRDGADGGGLVFYVTCRVWIATFGHTVLSYRAYSAFGCWLGFSATYLLLRSYYGRVIAVAATSAVWLGSRTILWQMVQTRFYGLLLGSAGLALLAAVTSAQMEDAAIVSRRERALNLLLTLVANLMLVGAHPFGVLYSAAILAGSAISDILQRRWRPAFYCAALLPWSVLLVSLTAMRNSAKVGQPHFWTTRPSLHELVAMYRPYSMVPVVFGSVFLLLCVGLLQAPARTRIAAKFKSRSAVLMPALILFVVPTAIWIVSQRGTSYFVDRYLIAFAIGSAILLAEAIEQLNVAYAPVQAGKLRFVYVGVALLSSFLLYRDALVTYPRNLALPSYDYTPLLASKFPAGLPIVIERVDLFTTTIAQQHERGLPVVYLLDWDVANAPDAPRGQVSGHHEMENWKREGYYAGSIYPVGDFLATHDRFLVLRDEHVRWLDRRILADPQWHARQIDTFFYNSDVNGTVWLVERHPEDDSNSALSYDRTR